MVSSERPASAGWAVKPPVTGSRPRGGASAERPVEAGDGGREGHHEAHGPSDEQERHQLRVPGEDVRRRAVEGEAQQPPQLTRSPPVAAR